MELNIERVNGQDGYDIYEVSVEAENNTNISVDALIWSKPESTPEDIDFEE